MECGRDVFASPTAACLHFDVSVFVEIRRMASWLSGVLSGEPGSQHEVVHRYTQRLLGLARRQLPQRLRQRVDPEDVVQSVYRSFFRRLNEGCFTFEDSHDLWRLLAAMTFHKARNAIKFHQRRRRDIRREDASGAVAGDQAASPAEPGDQDVTVLFDCLERLLAGLPDNYREIVVRRLDGDSIEQIAARVHRSRRTVLRVLAQLQNLAADELERSA